MFDSSATQWGASRALPEPPEHLTNGSAQWWREVVQQYEMDSHHLLLLTAAAEELDAAAMARETVAAEGATYLDRYGQVRPHPMLDVGRKARNSFRLMVRELGLDVAPVSEPRMAPRPGNR